VLALTGDVQASLFEGRDECVAVADRAPSDGALQMRPQGLADVCSPAGEVLRLSRAAAARIIRPRPSMLHIQRPLQRTEVALPTGRRDVEAPPRLQIAAGGEDVHVRTLGVAVEHRRPGVTVRVNSGPRDRFEAV